jgi:hypothetical protein
MFQIKVNIANYSSNAQLSALKGIKIRDKVK